MRPAALLLALGLLAPAARAQPEPPAEPPTPSEGVEQAQFAEPAPAPPGLLGAPQPGGGVVDPPAPVVRVAVRVPAVVAKNKPVGYTITVVNGSRATAYNVRVRHPVPGGINPQQPPQFQPAPKFLPNLAPAPPGGAQQLGFSPQGAPAAPGKDYVWTFAELKPGQAEKITAEFVPLPDTKSVTATVFVSFEHGETVTTQIDPPKLEVTSTAPQSATTGEPYTVAVEVANTGRVAIKKVKLVQGFPEGSVVDAPEGAIKGLAPGSTELDVGTLPPNKRLRFVYKVQAKSPGLAAAASTVTGEDAAPVTKESRTKVEEARLDLKLTGPARVTAGEAGEYAVTVTNTGTLPLGEVRVKVALPPGVVPQKMSAGGRATAEAIQWTGPPDRDRNGPLAPGDRFELRFKLKAERSGESAVRATADAGRSTEKSAEAKTYFDGSSVLKTRTDIAPGTTAVGQTGTITYTVTNSGDATAAKVRVVVKLPPQVKLDPAPPRSQLLGGELTFEPQDIPAGGEAVYKFTYAAVREGQASFEFLLYEAGREKPMESAKAVAVTGK